MYSQIIVGIWIYSDNNKKDLKVCYQKPGNVHFGLVHRLDRPIGGAMVFEKTSNAASRLSDMIRRYVIEVL